MFRSWLTGQRSVQLVAVAALLTATAAAHQIALSIEPTHSVEWVFLVGATLLAQASLLAFWVVACRQTGICWRVLGGLTGLVFLCFLSTVLFAGWTTLRATDPLPPHGSLFVVTGFLTSLLVIQLRSWFRRFRLARPATIATTRSQYQTSHLLLGVAVCAYASLLLRQGALSWRLAWDPFWDLTHLLLLTHHAAILGVLLPPVGLLVLEPSRWSLLWLPFGLLVCAVEPFTSHAAGTFLAVGGPGPFSTFPGWAQYAEAVRDGLFWHLPQLVPTLLLFLLWRMSGMQLTQES